MVNRIEEARRLVDAAATESDEAAVREQLQSVSVGLATVDEEPADATQGDRFEELEAKLVGLGDEVADEAVRRRVQNARDHIDAYRRSDAQDW